MNLRPPGYEPGELPDCSTPRRGLKDSIPPMPWWTWIALGLFALTVVAAAIFAAAFVVGLGVAVAGIRRMRELQSRAEAMTAVFEELMAKAEALEQRALTVEENRARLDAHLVRLAHSREKLGVLTWALRDATRDLTSFRNALRK